MVMRVTKSQERRFDPADTWQRRREQSAEARGKRLQPVVRPKPDRVRVDMLPLDPEWRFVSRLSWSDFSRSYMWDWRRIFPLTPEPEDGPW